ncbi:MAG: knotted carbamoyltransferase YgeW [Rickettsiales bacterium]|nr:knotted carbamoyltransferase YgeW [Rickettsiales bacterium]|tara:strand:- start:6295 stop:7440 length:1146 start_codon:yes stop_codon:yes gene_type:complete
MAQQSLTLPALDEAAVESLRGRSMFSTTDWTAAELVTLLQVADAFEALDRAGRRTELLRAELAYALFFDQSTRTKSAWAGAASRLGMQPVIVDGGSTQLSHGETAAETGAMLGMNSHAMGIRHDLILGEGNALMRDMGSGIAAYLKATADPRSVPIINLQCDLDHPTQTLADAMWLRERFPGGLSGRKIAVSWAYSPSYAKPLSVPQGLSMLLPRLGADVVLAHPPGYELLPDCLEAARQGAVEGGGSLAVVDSMDAAFADADVVYPKSWGPQQIMWSRVDANRRGDQEAMKHLEQQALEQNARHRDWICDERAMALTRNGAALYMHCLPADIGDEVSAGVMAKAQVDVAREANKKLYVIMALLASSKVPQLASRLRGLAG